MKTIDVEIAMMQHLAIRVNLIVPNVYWGIDNMHECDLLMLSPSGYATEFEIKVSKSDILNEKNKRHNHYHELITNFYFVVPENLKDIALQEIPKRAGLYIIKTTPNGTNFVEKIKKCKRLTDSKKWNNEERYKLARLGTLRILGLKIKIAKK